MRHALAPDHLISLLALLIAAALHYTLPQTARSCDSSTPKSRLTERRFQRTLLRAARQAARPIERHARPAPDLDDPAQWAATGVPQRGYRRALAAYFKFDSEDLADRGGEPHPRTENEPQWVVINPLRLAVEPDLDLSQRDLDPSRWTAPMGPSSPGSNIFILVLLALVSSWRGASGKRFEDRDDRTHQSGHPPGVSVQWAKVKESLRRPRLIPHQW